MKILDPIFEEYSAEPGNLITILQKTQERLGYLPKEAIDYIAERTGVRTAKIYGVATFYTQFRLKPVGRYILLLCKGTACHVNGAEKIVTAVSERLGIENGETTEDGLFTLSIVACLGCCSLAPVMMVRGPGGEEVYGNLTRDSVIKILDRIGESGLGEDAEVGA